MISKTDGLGQGQSVLTEVCFGLAISDDILSQINQRDEQNQHWWQSLDEYWRTLMWRKGLGKDENAPKMPSHESLRMLASLAVLDLSGCSLKDIRPLAHLSYLNALTLNDNAISDISPLAHLPHLSYLELEGNQISDIRPLSTLNKLMVLSLGFNAISDISPLSSLSELVRLDLYYNQISDIRPLAKLTALECLFLGYEESCGTFYAKDDTKPNHILDISPLAHCRHLSQLWLTQVGVSDISALAHLDGLTQLGLSYNPILDLRPLAQLTKLQVLCLAGVDNPEQIEKLHTLHPNCYIES